MKFIVIFHEYMEIIEASSDQVYLEKYQGWTHDDWKKVPLRSLTPIVVHVVHEDERYEATLLQVVPDDYDTKATIRFLRDIRMSKKKRIPTFLSMMDRVLEGRKRQAFPRTELLSTSESEAEPVESSQRSTHVASKSTAAEAPQKSLQLLPSPPPPQRKAAAGTPSAATPSAATAGTSDSGSTRDVIGTVQHGMNQGRHHQMGPTAGGNSHSSGMPAETPRLSRDQHGTSFLAFGDACVQQTREALEAKSGLSMGTEEGRTFAIISIFRQLHVTRIEMQTMMEQQRQLQEEMQRLRHQLFSVPGGQPMEMEPSPVDSWQEYADFIQSAEAMNSRIPHLLTCKASKTYNTVLQMVDKCLTIPMQRKVNFIGRGLQQRSQLPVGMVTSNRRR